MSAGAALAPPREASSLAPPLASTNINKATNESDRV